ncbi:hypothetical protein ACWDUG_29230 [Streptomyces cellulosae]
MTTLAHTAREAGTTVLLITHDARTAAYVAGRCPSSTAWSWRRTPRRR